MNIHKLCALRCVYWYSVVHIYLFVYYSTYSYMITHCQISALWDGNTKNGMNLMWRTKPVPATQTHTLTCPIHVAKKAHERTRATCTFCGRKYCVRFFLNKRRSQWIFGMVRHDVFAYAFDFGGLLPGRNRFDSSRTYGLEIIEKKQFLIIFSSHMFHYCQAAELQWFTFLIFVYN